MLPSGRRVLSLLKKPKDRNPFLTMGGIIMGLFQKAILRKYLKGLDDKITSAYQQFVNYFLFFNYFITV